MSRRVITNDANENSTKNTSVWNYFIASIDAEKHFLKEPVLFFTTRPQLLDFYLQLFHNLEQFTCGRSQNLRLNLCDIATVVWQHRRSPTSKTLVLVCLTIAF